MYFFLPSASMYVGTLQSSVGGFAVGGLYVIGGFAGATGWVGAPDGEADNAVLALGGSAGVVAPGEVEPGGADSDELATPGGGCAATWFESAFGGSSTRF